MYKILIDGNTWKSVNVRWKCATAIKSNKLKNIAVHELDRVRDVDTVISGALNAHVPFMLLVNLHVSLAF